jgi:hypothetical protein
VANLLYLIPILNIAFLQALGIRYVLFCTVSPGRVRTWWPGIWENIAVFQSTSSQSFCFWAVSRSSLLRTTTGTVGVLGPDHNMAKAVLSCQLFNRFTW